MIKLARITSTLVLSLAWLVLILALLPFAGQPTVTANRSASGAAPVISPSNQESMLLTQASAQPMTAVVILMDDFMPQPYPGDPLYHHNRLDGERQPLGDVNLSWEPGKITATASTSTWGSGMWTSFNYPLGEKRPVNFSTILPSPIASEYQGAIIGLAFRISDATPNNHFKAELKNEQVSATPIWSQSAILTSGAQVLSWYVPPLTDVTNLNWFLENPQSGDYVVVESIALTATNPITDIATAGWVWSYAMLLNNWNPATGLVRDKAQDASGTFDAIQATGSLAAATAIADQLGVISRTDALQIVNQISSTLLITVPRYHGLWPHWVREISPSGPVTIVAGTEWSSVDTVIAALGLLEAQSALGLDTSGTEQMLQAIDWDSLQTPGGISHGYNYTGALLPYTWDTFGGESWLVELAHAAATGHVTTSLQCVDPPRTANGSGFIDELAWLFFPPPAGRDHWGVDWAAYRDTAASTQVSYYPTHYPTSCLSQLGLFGLSAAEVPVPPAVAKNDIYQAFGVGGCFSPPNDGTTLLGAPVAVPHYSAMIASLRPQHAITMWTWLINDGPFSPLNNLESLMFPAGSSCTANEVEWNQLKGSWNLALQTLGWGRYLAERRGQYPILWQAAWTGPFLRSGYRLLAPSASLDVCQAGCMFTSIQSAINAAATGDLIRVAQGIYTGTSLLTKTLILEGGYSGPPNWQRDISAYSTILNGNGVGPVIQITDGFSPTLDGFIITGGRAYNGGGIYISDSAPTLAHNTIISNAASWYGGGIYIESYSSPSLVSNTLVSNIAYWGGGICISNYSSPTLSSNTVISNSADWGGGGGIYISNYSSPVLTSNTLVSNTASGGGGGIYVTDYSAPILNHNIITGNQSAGSGGGVFIYGYSAPTLDSNQIIGNSSYDGGGILIAQNSRATLINNLIALNQAQRWGGGMEVSGSSPTLKRNIISQNYAGVYGGGVHAIGGQARPVLDSNQIISNTAVNGAGVFVDDYSAPVLINNVIARNHGSSNGGGIYIDYYSTPGIVNNTIVANNLGPAWANEGIFMYNTPSPTITNNIIVSHSCAIVGTPLTGTIDYNVVLSDNIWDPCCGMRGPHDICQDPRFVDPAHDDYHIRWDSPAIDKGTNVGAPSSDFEDDLRPLWNGTDIGADEYSGPYTRIPLWYDDGWWLLGVNYPWLHYGHDFGQAAWPGGSWSHDGMSTLSSTLQVESDFAYLRSKGVHTLRLFVFGDGRASPEFDAQGYVTGFDSYFYHDLDTAVSLACQNDLHLIPVLMDYLWLASSRWVGGVQLGGHADIITDTAKRQSFLNNALRPLLERYGNNRCIVAWDVINEPEWTMRGVPGGGTITPTVSITEMQSFAQDVVTFTHLYASQDATLGSAKGEWITYWRGVNLDFYQFHYYDWMGTQPPFTSYLSLGLDRPAILGEFPTSSAISVTTFLSTTWDNGYAGALAWSLNGNDTASDFRRIADPFKGWSLAHDADVNIPQVVYDVALAPSTAAQSGNPGVIVTYTLWLTNTGNAPDTFDVALGGNSWMASLPMTMGVLAPSVGTNVVLSVTIPLNTLAGAHDTTIVTATSRNDVARLARSVLTTTANAVHNVVLDPAAITRSANPNVTVTYVLTLSNTGNAADSFAVVGNKTAFTTIITPTNIPSLGAGMSRTVTVTVQTPAYRGGIRDVAVITATSQGDPTRSVASTLTTIVLCNQGQVNAMNAAVYNLDRYVADWGVYCEISPTWAMGNATSPSLDSESLQLSLTGGDPYSNAHFYRQLLSDTAATVFTYTVPFWISPTTTCNNDPTPSIVQAIEFSANKWWNEKRYEWALQWQNVGVSAPQWRYWQVDHWVTPTPPIKQCLQGGRWYTLTLEGEILNGQVHYRRFAVDQQTHELGITIAPAAAISETDRLAVAVQLDGNYTNDPYDVFVDQMTLLRSANIGVALTPSAAAQSANPGAVVTYQLTLTNTGNMTDSFALTSSSPPFTTLVTPTSVISLSGRASQGVTVTMQIPSSAAGGATSVAIITATSQASVTQFARSTLTTTVRSYTIYLPLVVKQ